MKGLLSDAIMQIWTDSQDARQKMFTLAIKQRNTDRDSDLSVELQ